MNKDRQWARNLSGIERVQFATMNGDRRRVLNGSSTIQAGNRAERQLRPKLRDGRSVYTEETIFTTDNATPIVWYRDVVGIGIAGIGVTPPYIRMARNPWSGFEWQRTLLPVQPAPSDVNQSLAYTLEILDIAGATTKTAQINWTYSAGGVLASSAWTFDGNGPVEEFYGVRMSLAGSFSPSPPSVTPGALLVLQWLLGDV